MALRNRFVILTKAAGAYANGLRKEKDFRALKRAFSEAQKKWDGGFRSMGEGQRPYGSLCFRQRDPFQEESTLFKEFQDLSLQILEPMLRHSKMSNISS